MSNQFVENNNNNDDDDDDDEGDESNMTQLYNEKKLKIKFFPVTLLLYQIYKQNAL